MFPVADGHCDYLYGAVQTGYDLRKPKRDQAIRLDDMLTGGGCDAVFCLLDRYRALRARAAPMHRHD